MKELGAKSQNIANIALSLSLSLYIYIYIYICVCVCVCTRACVQTILHYIRHTQNAFNKSKLILLKSDVDTDS